MADACEKCGHALEPGIGCVAFGMRGLIVLTVEDYTAALRGAPVEVPPTPRAVVPADPNVERAQLIELCGRVSAYEAAYAAIDGAINDPALDTARTYEIIRNALASVLK